MKSRSRETVLISGEPSPATCRLTLQRGWVMTIVLGLGSIGCASLWLTPGCLVLCTRRKLSRLLPLMLAKLLGKPDYLLLRES